MGSLGWGYKEITDKLEIEFIEEICEKHISPGHTPKKIFYRAEIPCVHIYTDVQKIVVEATITAYIPDYVEQLKIFKRKKIIEDLLKD